MKIIFVNGWTKSGKDELFKTLENFYDDLKIKRVAFADPLKQQYSKNFEVPLQELYMEKYKEQHREGLIKFAEDSKKVDPTLYARKAFKNFFQTKEECDVLIITDFRDLVELKYWESRLNTKIETLKIKSLNKPDAKYWTEFLLEDFKFDYYIENYGTLETFQLKIKDWFGINFYNSVRTRKDFA